MDKFSDNVDYLNNVISPGITGRLDTLPGILNTLIPYLLVFSGLILFFMLLSGGFQMLMAGADPKQADAGKQRLTTAIIGFFIIILAYWITQIMQIIFGVNILN